MIDLIKLVKWHGLSAFFPSPISVYLCSISSYVLVVLIASYIFQRSIVFLNCFRMHTAREMLWAHTLTHIYNMYTKKVQVCDEFWDLVVRVVKGKWFFIRIYIHIVCMHAYFKSSGPIFHLHFNKGFSPSISLFCYWLNHTITETDVCHSIWCWMCTIHTNSIFTTFSIINSLLHTYRNH